MIEDCDCALCATHEGWFELPFDAEPEVVTVRLPEGSPV